MRSHVCHGLLGLATILAVLGLTIGTAYGLTAGDLVTNLGRLIGRAMTVLPAIWVIVGLTTALYGLAPRIAPAASWSLFSLFLLLELGWEFRLIPQRLFCAL